MSKEETQVDASGSMPGLRRCFRTPVPEIALAARLLDDAVTAHKLGHRHMAEELIKMANLRVIGEWIDSIWGKASPHIQYRKVVGEPNVHISEQRTKNRMPSEEQRRTLLERDGYHCRFCEIPLIRSEIREIIQRLYPAALEWGRTNHTQHAAFQAMWLQYDHLSPHSRGGDDSLENFVITCAACNFGRMEKTLAEVGLEDPRNREPFRSDWNGLERILTTRFHTKSIEIREGPVDRDKEYFELRYGRSVNGSDDWMLIAFVGLADTRTANVELLVGRDDKVHVDAAKKVWKELRFYFVESKEEDPWTYAQHHCSTNANIYSEVHWSFFRGKFGDL